VTLHLHRSISDSTRFSSTLIAYSQDSIHFTSATSFLAETFGRNGSQATANV